MSAAFNFEKELQALREMVVDVGNRVIIKEKQRDDAVDNEKLFDCYQKDLEQLHRERNELLAQQSKLLAALIPQASPPRVICGIVVADVFKLAAEMSCRTEIERFANEAAKLHDSEAKTCIVRLNCHEVSTTFKLTHYEYCDELTKDEGHLLDKKHDAKLPPSAQPPTKGTFKDLFNTLSRRIHNSSILRTQDGKAVVLYDLPAVEKRLLVRTLMCLGEEVVIFDGTCVRPPNDDEINTPPKCANDASVKRPSPETPLESPKRCKRQ